MAYLNPERNSKAVVQCPEAPHTIVGDLLAPGNVLAPWSVESDVSQVMCLRLYRCYSVLNVPISLSVLFRDVVIVHEKTNSVQLSPSPSPDGVPQASRVQVIYSGIWSPTGELPPVLVHTMFPHVVTCTGYTITRARQKKKWFYAKHQTGDYSTFPTTDSVHCTFIHMHTMINIINYIWYLNILFH